MTVISMSIGWIFIAFAIGWVGGAVAYKLSKGGKK